MTGWLWNELFAWHDTGTAAGFLNGPAIQPLRHLESAESKARLASLVAVSGMADIMTPVEHQAAAEEDLLRVHTPEHVKNMKELSIDPRGGDMGDGFSPFATGGFDIARLAAGGTISAVQAVLEGSVQNAYALVRPPGHHARPEMGMGFCMFSNIPIAVENARAVNGIGRVAVVDFDVHHGNGTEACFEEDPNTLTISLHQDRNFPPDTGFVDHRGTGKGFGTAINIPLPSGCGIGGYAHAFDQIVLPALDRFRPELILVACGFDASFVDPLGRMMLLSEDYATLTSKLMGAAERLCNGRLVFSHEGGYSPFYVPFCGLAVVETLTGQKSGVDDPYLEYWKDAPGRQLMEAQIELVTEVQRFVCEVPEPEETATET
ncbi:class II histone deacetylase [uncultured Roseovarius sp.]|uniref:class II histone deacetylase n=1 Tax=uncultured Roseovarius sp. TaxID=293344 RepID=UPI00260AE7F9|nr:class II histone deacetylase [uncultured Roseovarius sp.]